MEFLVGTGLAASAGLNAWMPLFLLGIADRFLGWVELPAGWAWLSGDIALWVTGALLVVEFVADKVPAVDSVNDVIQTVIRPASGGIVFGAGASAQTVAVEDPSTFFSTGTWLPIVSGIVIALGVHAVKATVRPVANAATAGVAAPALSTAEDASALALIASAILVPVLAGILVLLLLVAAIVLWRRWRRRSRGRGAAVTTA